MIAKLKSKNILNGYLFFVVLIIFSIYVHTIYGNFADFKVLITNFMILALSSYFMVNGDSYNYSLNKILMLFSFFFFGIAPALQYKQGVILWGGPSFSCNSYYRLNIIILIILLIYQGLYSVFSRTKSKHAVNETMMVYHNKDKYSGTILLFLSLASLLITLHFNNYDFINLIFRAGGDINRLAVDQSINLIYGRFIRPIPVVALVVFKIYCFRDRKIEIPLLFFALISNFPTSSARYYIAAMYIPLLLVYFKQFNDKYLFMNKVLIFGLLFVFPFLNQARKVNKLSDMVLSFDLGVFTSGHYDSYQMFMRVIENNIITMGRQLISVLLFFIPRSYWPSKAMGSGHLVSYDIRLIFDNISMNYFGEGYINFGFVGIMMFIIVIAYVNAKLDKLYWENTNNYSWISIFYLFFLGLEFFILRGDLLSSFAYTVGIGFSTIFVYVVVSKFTFSRNLRKTYNGYAQNVNIRR